MCLDPHPVVRSDEEIDLLGADPVHLTVVVAHKVLGRLLVFELVGVRVERGERLRPVNVGPALPALLGEHLRLCVVAGLVEAPGAGGVGERELHEIRPLECRLVGPAAIGERRHVDRSFDGAAELPLVGRDRRDRCRRLQFLGRLPGAARHGPRPKTRRSVTGQHRLGTLPGHLSR